MPMLRYQYAIGSMVFLRISDDGEPGQVTGVGSHSPGSCPAYEVSWPDRSTTHHFEYELTTDIAQTRIATGDVSTTDGQDDEPTT